MDNELPEGWDDVDDTHPIPNLDVVDVIAALRDGGARLIIVIATPLAGDLRSLHRLRTKLEGHLSYIQSKEFEDEFHRPRRGPVTLEVAIPKNSDPLAFDLLSRCDEWAREYGANLEVTTKKPGA